mmetsp:Transcript_11799/g.11330  ORF Transcript_11799/g.11330 Transcript_11799/m.11330 type:complete len:250 (-) Transcript_11799:305-1054(-)|eukprot:CAMPEP_0197829272 /NCGR_PEP_ID=MMETSP1437-20131217/5681_1 /TAXON_ID=49252 ORGANISM="Eucampia antarctica, Strain CCMP1452" /NCGR_SAMPLE_ID=MMETSP1437 /ASSEMBLY_ACC=CAM_ASM_001096 /LENGTH=249 /DNA_ID=CAMNT_0043430825 /DNA_START=65 /DNA_END=814 /DNA_ORIENTATION=-
MVKVSAVACALLAASSASAYSVNRSSIRSLGGKSLGNSASRKVDASMKMEDFGLFKGTGIGFDDLWDGNDVISEVGIENELNKNGLRYRMNRTPEEGDEVGTLLDLPGVKIDIPILGKVYFGPPKVANIWEALGFTATSNNEARQNEKIKAIEKARGAVKGVKGGPGAEIRKSWLDKYGYPRLVGSGGIFYADQLSSDKEPMGGFNMGKSGQIWPVPDVVKKGNYGGAKGWGIKKAGKTIDGLKKADKI